MVVEIPDSPIASPSRGPVPYVLNVTKTGLDFTEALAGVPSIANTGTLITASAVTTTQTSTQQTKTNATGLRVYINVTTLQAANTLAVHIRARNTASGITPVDLLVGASISAAGQAMYEIGPGITATANVSAATGVPYNWDVQVVQTGVGPNTYTVAFDYQ